MEIFHLVGGWKEGVQCEYRVLPLVGEGEHGGVLAVRHTEVQLGPVSKQGDVLDVSYSQPLVQNTVGVPGGVEEGEFLCDEGEEEKVEATARDQSVRLEEGEKYSWRDGIIGTCQPNLD